MTTCANVFLEPESDFQDSPLQPQYSRLMPALLAPIQGSVPLVDGSTDHNNPFPGNLGPDRTGTTVFFPAHRLRGTVTGFHGHFVKSAPVGTGNKKGHLITYWWVHVSDDRFIIHRWRPLCQRTWRTLSEVTADPDLSAQYRALFGS